MNVLKASENFLFALGDFCLPAFLCIDIDHNIVVEYKQGQRSNERHRRSEGRGGADNLGKDILREIAKMIRVYFL